MVSVSPREWTPNPPIFHFLCQFHPHSSTINPKFPLIYIKLVLGPKEIYNFPPIFSFPMLPFPLWNFVLFKKVKGKKERKVDKKNRKMSFKTYLIHLQIGYASLVTFIVAKDHSRNCLNITAIVNLPPTMSPLPNCLIFAATLYSIVTIVSFPAIHNWRCRSQPLSPPSTSPIVSIPIILVFNNQLYRHCFCHCCHRTSLWLPPTVH